MSRSFRATGARARQQGLRTLLVAAAASVGTGLLLTACSATSGSGGGHAAAPLKAAAGAPGRQAARAVGNGPAAGSDHAASSFSGGKAARLLLSTQSIIYTANMTVRVVKDVPGTASKVTAIVTDVGGYVAGEREMFPQGKFG